MYKSGFDRFLWRWAGRYPAAPFYLLVIIAVFIVKNNVFFWDTVQLGARHAYWFYEQGLRGVILPEEIDSGHPPAFGLYLSQVWKIVGISLPASHFAMLPFLLGIVFFGARVMRRLGGKAAVAPGLLLLAVDPTLAAQGLLVSPDIWIVLGFLAGIDAVLARRPRLKAAAALLLALTSLRGMMVVVILFFFDALREFLPGASAGFREKPFAFLLRKALPYVPAGISALVFLLYHHAQTGWTGYHAGSPWAPAFERVDLAGFLYNVGLLGWRTLDFGRVFVCMALLLLLIRLYRLRQGHHLLWQMALLLGLSLLVLAPSLLLHKLMAHRYLLPVFVALTLLLMVLLTGPPRPTRHWRQALYLMVLTGLLTGNRWVYPDHIAQGWDATLAHLPYYELRGQMLRYIEEESIPYQLVGTAFPEIGPLSYRDLSGRRTGFAEKDLDRQSYIYYSNIMNDFTDAELEQLRRNWREIRRFERRGVRVSLYGKPGRRDDY